MPNTREKLMRLLCAANSKATEAEAFEDATYAQQLGIQADHLIANGVTVTDTNVGKWIPVTERLPEANMAVLIYDGDTVDGFTFFDLSYVSKYGVTHWMPLPEAPKGE
jgi:hypothetical protein